MAEQDAARRQLEEAEHARLTEEAARRREAAERDHAAAMNKLLAAQREAEQNAAARLQTLTKEYDEGHAIFLRLKRELALLQDQEEDVSFGLYKPSFAFDTPEKYKNALDKVWADQKALIREDRATACPHEQRELRERLKEEEKAQREAARIEEDATKEEARYEKALAKARADLEKAKGAELEVLNAKLAALEQSLAEAQAQKARAKSMAEQTRSGYVYIISNLGSFGEHVYRSA